MAKETKAFIVAGRDSSSLASAGSGYYPIVLSAISVRTETGASGGLWSNLVTRMAPRATTPTSRPRAAAHLARPHSPSGRGLSAPRTGQPRPEPRAAGKAPIYRRRAMPGSDGAALGGAAGARPLAPGARCVWGTQWASTRAVASNRAQRWGCGSRRARLQAAGPDHQRPSERAAAPPRCTAAPRTSAVSGRRGWRSRARGAMARRGRRMDAGVASLSRFWGATTRRPPMTSPGSSACALLGHCRVCRFFRDVSKAAWRPKSAECPTPAVGGR